MDQYLKYLTISIVVFIVAFISALHAQSNQCPEAQKSQYKTACTVCLLNENVTCKDNDTKVSSKFYSIKLFCVY